MKNENEDDGGGELWQYLALGNSFESGSTQNSYLTNCMGTNHLLQAAKHMAPGSTETHQLEKNVSRNTDCRKKLSTIFLGT